MTTQVAWLAPICAAIGIIVAAYLGSWVLKQNPGPDKMNSISLKIQQGAQAFLMSEYKLLIIFMVVVAVIMAVALSPITAIAFVRAACCRPLPVTWACTWLPAPTPAPLTLPRNRWPRR